MTTTNNRLVFGSDEARDLLEQSKANEKTRKINSKLESLINGVQEIGELIAGVRGIEKKRGFQPKIEELLRKVNWLQVDTSCTWNIANELTETSDMLDNAAYIIQNIMEQLDVDERNNLPNNVLNAVLYAEEFLEQEPNERVNATENIIGLFES